MTSNSSVNGDPSYQVALSGAIAAEIRRLAARATREGRNTDFVSALQRIIARLRRDPMTFGEPQYRLPALQLQVRCAVIRPLVMYFAVPEERPEVYIQKVKLL